MAKQEYTKIKPMSPLQAMIKKRHEDEKLSIKHEPLQTQPAQEKSLNENIILEVDPHRVRNWHLADRPLSELKSVKELAKEFSDPDIGQKVPCTVRLVYNDQNADYEVITGEQRWRAAKLAGTKLKVIVKQLDDNHAAIEQILENRRDNLSEYAQGMSYAKLMNANVLKQKELESIVGLDPVAINRMLSFSQVPEQIWNTIGDMSKVSSRTASEIRAILKKNPEHEVIIKELAPLIGSGKIGASTLKREILKREGTLKNQQLESKEVRNNSGRHLFSWRGDSNRNMSISFPKDIRVNLNQEDLEKSIKREIERQLSEIEASE